MAVDRWKGVRVLFRPINGTVLISAFILLLIVAVNPVLRLVRVLAKVLGRYPYLARLPWRAIWQGNGALNYVLKIAGRREETSSRAVKWTWSSCQSLVRPPLPPSLPPRTSYLPWWIRNRHYDLPSRQPPSRRPLSPRRVWCHTNTRCSLWV